MSLAKYLFSAKDDAVQAQTRLLAVEDTGSESRVRLYDVSDPSNFVEVGNVNINQSVDFFITGQRGADDFFVFFVNGHHGAFTKSGDTLTKVLHGQIGGVLGADSVEFSWDYDPVRNLLFLGENSSQDDLLCIDYSATTPVVRDDFSHSDLNNVYSVWYNADTEHVFALSQAVDRVVQIRTDNPDSLARRTATSISGHVTVPEGITGSSALQRVYVGGRDELCAINISSLTSQPVTWSQAGLFSDPAAFMRVDEERNLLIVVEEGTVDAHIFDLTNPDSPVRLARVTAGLGRTLDGAAYDEVGGIIYTSWSDEQWRVFDVNQPLSATMSWDHAVLMPSGNRYRGLLLQP